MGSRGRDLGLTLPLPGSGVHTVMVVAGAGVKGRWMRFNVITAGDEDRH